MTIPGLRNEPGALFPAGRRPDPAGTVEESKMPENPQFLEDIRRSALEDWKSVSWDGTFEEYMGGIVASNPVPHIRTSFQYMRDMFEFFGWEPREDAGDTFRHYKLFDDPIHGGKKAVFGLERTLEKLVNYIRAASLEEGKERIFVLSGPVGTAKTTIVDQIARGLEEFSLHDEGAVYSIAWLFPRQIDDEAGALGFVRTGPETDDVFARVRCQMRDNPFFLVPRKQRAAFIDSLLSKAGFTGRKRPVVPRKLVEGELCYNCTQIYNYLLRRFGGDWTRIIGRARVERIVLSELSGTGVSKIMPEGNVETSASIISFDDNYKALSLLMSDINLVKFNGKYVSGNRGLIQYSDIFKKPVVYLQHLLSACEEHRIDFGEVGADIDVVIIGTSNLPEYEAFRKNPLSHGIRSRMRRIEVPFLLNYRDEMKIYDQGLVEVARTRHVAPHTTELAALWAVLTRLIKSELHKNEQELKVDERDLVEKLSHIQKAVVYAGEVPRDFDRETRKALSKDLVKKLRNEFTYEGMAGISPRVIQNLFADICESKRYQCLTPFDFFNTMAGALEKGAEMYEFLNAEASEESDDVLRHLEAVNALYDAVIKEEIETAVTDVNEEEILRKIRDYLNSVKAFLRKEKLPSRGGKGEEPPNEDLMRYVESMLSVEDADRDEFRFKILSRASGAVAGGRQLDISDTYSDLIRAVRTGFYAEKKSKVNWDGIVAALEKADTEEGLVGVPEWTRPLIETFTGNMTTMFGYCRACSRDVVSYAVRKRLLG